MAAAQILGFDQNHARVFAREPSAEAGPGDSAASDQDVAVARRGHR